jgi:hypothetical protein
VNLTVLVMTVSDLDSTPIARPSTGGPLRSYVWACRRVRPDGEPLLAHHNRTLDGRTRQYEALWLPLSDDGENVTMLLAALIYDWERE